MTFSVSTVQHLFAVFAAVSLELVLRGFEQTSNCILCIKPCSASRLTIHCLFCRYESYLRFVEDRCVIRFLSDLIYDFSWQTIKMVD